MTEQEYIEQRAVILADMHGKIKRNDMHGVADCAMDIRDLDAFWKGYTTGLNGKVSIR